MAITWAVGEENEKRGARGTLYIYINFLQILYQLVFHKLRPQMDMTRVHIPNEYGHHSHHLDMSKKP